jgi:putative ABC transport system permease protein
MNENGLSVFNYKKYDWAQFVDLSGKPILGSINSRQDLIDNFNKLNEQQVELIANTIAVTNPKNVIHVGGGMVYIILGSGISADFIYPIVSIAKPNPNPAKECIFYSNRSGYQRTVESFQSCPTEKYIVLKMKGSTDADKIVKQIND